MTSDTFFKTLKLAEKLKFELRHSWLSNGRRESVAEHTWRMSFMAILLHKKLEKPVNLERVLKMIIIHDLVEAEVGDIPAFEVSERMRMKQDLEREAISRIRSLIGRDIGDDIHDLWHEFEDKKTPESKFAQALDKLEAQIQHNEADYETWNEIERTEKVHFRPRPFCEYDPFLNQLCEEIIEQAEAKIAQSKTTI
ncbi:MAG: HD domain-containing protein [Opitutales bacterium]|tara:strand:- start:881 stop:1468 length:588 start_codon:yes stop_codon:yes gene_type:complete